MKVENNKSALLMSLSEVSGSGRPIRIIGLLRELDISVDVLSFPCDTGPYVQEKYFVKRPTRNRAERMGRVLNSLASRFILCFPGSSKWIEKLNDMRHYLLEHEIKLRLADYQIIIVEDLQLLPLAFRISGQARIIFDAREYYPLQNEERFSFRVLESPQRSFLCRRYLKRCHALFTVSPGLVDQYRSIFNVEMNLLRSTPEYRCLPVSTCDHEKIRMVHHGIANPNRELERMIEIVFRLDERFTLDFYLVGPLEHIGRLKTLASRCKRINFREPVPFSRLVETISDYDIGFFYVEPSTFNLRHCLPNKLFEFVQARLAVAIGPSPDMSDIVTRYRCGFVSDEFSISSMTRMLGSLTPEKIFNAKKASNLAAKELCFENESRILSTMVADLLKK